MSFVASCNFTRTDGIELPYLSYDFYVIGNASLQYSQQKGLSSEEEVETSEREDNLGPADEEYSLPLGPWATLRTPVCELVGHTNAVIAADWIVGGDQAVTASWDRTANIWDVTTGELLHQLVGRQTA